MRRGVAATAVVALAALLLLGLVPAASAADDPPTAADPASSSTPTPSPTADDPTAPDPSATPTPAASAAVTGPVQNVRWTLLSTTSVELQWSPPADAQGSVRYLVVARTNGAAERSLSTTSTHVTFTNIAPGTRVVPDITPADRAAVLGADTWQAWTQPALAPTAPNVLQLAAAASGASLVAAWSTPADDGGADIQSYTVYLYDGAGLLDTEQTVDADVHTTLFAGLTPGAQYTAGITANNTAGASPELQSGAATVPAAAPTASGSASGAAPVATPNIGGQGAQAVGASPRAVVASSAGRLSPVVPLVLSIAAVLLAAAAGIVYLLQRRAAR